MLERSRQASSLGVIAGCTAGVASVLADFGAHWLFLESTEDRAWLLLRLLSFAPTACAAVFAACGLAHALLARLPRATRMRTAAAGALLLAPATLTVAHLLFTGGTMSRLPGRRVLEPLVMTSLVIGTAALLYAAQRLFDAARRMGAHAARNVMLALVAAALALGKLNQHALPNLYDYLHGVLTVVAAALYALAALLVITRWLDAGRLRAALAPVAGTLSIGLCAATYASAATLDHNQNVRVALLHANVAHTRSLMLALGPLLPELDDATVRLAKRRAELARERRAAQRTGADLPAFDGAHVLLVTVDALRADRVGAYGYARGITPELDRLAARGVLFERAYAQAPHSSYSLCSLMTSEYLHETLEMGLPAPEATLPRVLHDNGYHTAAFYTQGIFHTAGERLRRYETTAFGFALHEHQDRPAEAMTDRVLAEIDRTLSRGEPSTLLWAHYFDVHEPYDDTTLGTAAIDRYDSEIRLAVRAIGRLVREAERRLTRPLIVVVTADHGEEFLEHGGVYHGSSLYEEQVRVPLIVLAPGLASRRVAAPVQLIDAAPSILRWLGIEPPASMRGDDLRALATGVRTERGPVFSAVIHKKMVVRDTTKLIADLRFGLFELYDLSRDALERVNLADREPARVQELRGEVYAWLDSLQPAAGARRDPALTALEWGRMGDRRAVAPMSQLMLDERAAVEHRREAARLLGRLADPSSAASLLAAIRGRNRWVAAEAAIALGRMFDPRAAPSLRELVNAEDPGLRSRAAVSLGRLRDTHAVPALIDALWVAPSQYEREEAIRWLGRLRDLRAIDPLLNLLPEGHVRHLVVLALGELGDPRAYEPLSRVLATERNASVRDGVAHGLGLLGDARALELLVPLAVGDASLSSCGESLVRLHAIERERIGGADVTRAQPGLRGFGDCYVGPERHDWDYLHRTYCTTANDEASFRLRVPPRLLDEAPASVAVLSIRRADAGETARLEISLGDHALGEVAVDGGWVQLRWPVSRGVLASGDVRARLRSRTRGARFDVDHLLLLPRGG